MIDQLFDTIIIVASSDVPANSHASGVSLTPGSWKLQSHANSRFSRLEERI